MAQDSLHGKGPPGRVSHGVRYPAIGLPKEGEAWDAGDDGLILPAAVKTASTGNAGASIGIGVGAGALSGFLVGVLMGLSAGDDHCQPSDTQLCLFVMSAKQKAVLYGLLMHLPGAGLGALIGAGAANQEVFEAPGNVGRTLPYVSLVPVRGGAAGSVGWAF